MNKIALTTLILGLTAAGSTALAQNAPQPCPPGSWLCADVTIGGPPPPVPVIVQPPPPPPPVMVQPPPPQPPPPVMYSPPPPPPPVVILPRHPRIIFAPAPPARVYVMPAPQPTVIYQPQPVYVQGPQYVGPMYPAPYHRRGHVGLQLDVAGALFSGASGGTSAMAGVGGGFRFRGAGHLGAEIAIGGYWGNDYNGDHRTEVPVSFNGLLYFNPMHRLQVYGILGLGFSWADVNYNSVNAMARGRSNANYSYFGADAGLGLELQITPHMSAFADARGFIRTRIDDGANSNPDYSRTTASGNTQTTNASMGVLTQAGLVFYF